jgi:hypothetical protein
VILARYEQAWPLRHTNPAAFATGICAALGAMCRDLGARNGTLFQQLRELVARGTFSGYYEEMVHLVCQAGNEDMDYWDAELLDDLFRSLVEYVYVTPSKIERFKQRLTSNTSGPEFPKP